MAGNNSVPETVNITDSIIDKVAISFIRNGPLDVFKSVIDFNCVCLISHISFIIQRLSVINL